MEYVTGFMFSPGGLTVALIKKERPEWQRGFLNGIGGKIEEGEQPCDAMRREFREETGVDCADWRLFCTLSRHNEQEEWKVHFFTTLGDVTALRSMEDEEIVVVFADEIGKYKTIPNLRWLIPMAQDRNAVVAAVIEP